METQRNASRRAMEAAARVAARYANAPSYSDVLANEARAALRAAEAASRAALHAQAAAQSVLAGLEAAHAVEAELAPAAEPAIEWPRSQAPAPELDEFPSASQFFDVPLKAASDPEPSLDPGPELVPELVRSELPTAYAPIPAEPIAEAVTEPIPLRWDLELPVHPAAPVETRAARGQELFETGAEGWWRPAAAEPERAEPEPIEMVEPVPIPANLIEFPRELVATRKARPRLAEGLSTAQEAAQLSIFEVDPISISIDPAVEEVSSAAQPWTAPTWSGMELEAQPAREAYDAAPAALPEAFPVFSAPAIPYAVVAPEVAPAQEAAPALATATEAATVLAPAPATLRLMAMVVDGALIAGALLAGAVFAASRASALPGLRATEIGLGLAMVAAAIVYQMLFFTLGRATPGMRYAQIRLTTFDGVMPVRAERYRRMAALLVSALPLGLGIGWALFDDDHLTWHDRLSRTYLCKR